ncbi:TRAP transporter small permease [Nocardiopsis flavescens]|uniref:TRAP-type mannitol/chloroaromatic compound transport system, small permease component n=1 Tax=Nocardiopsis flavescens TaxID=758803 RepID=A0A1M6UC37_9ACTN|nr:TRAP transporter small permease [Nocardiopsis flavescens]SHK66746.1 TRAP-type mannitol/chloroaromatic compound transport system, small permease component [Nocardiopsis flavescens]
MTRFRPTRPLASASTVFSLAAGLLLLVLMLLTVADVVSRNVQGRSILGTVDISTLLLVAVAFLGLSSAELDGRHVAVSLIEERLGHRTRTVLSAVRAVLLVVVGALMVWGLGEVLFSAVDRSETTNDILRLPTWPAKLVLFLSFLLFFVAAVGREAARLRARLAGREPDDGPAAATEAVVIDAGAPDTAPEPVSPAAAHHGEVPR